MHHARGVIPRASCPCAILGEAALPNATSPCTALECLAFSSNAAQTMWASGQHVSQALRTHACLVAQLRSAARCHGMQPLRAGQRLTKRQDGGISPRSPSTSGFLPLQPWCMGGGGLGALSEYAGYELQLVRRWPVLCACYVGCLSADFSRFRV